MPSRPKPSAKPAPKLSSSYPNPLPPSLQSHPPALRANEKTSSNSSYDAQHAEWTAGNARAKAIIMANLDPGSEPWQIAEPLEYAADIWKALEKKYGPEARARDENEHGIMHEESAEPAVDDGRPDQSSGGRAQTKDCLSQEPLGGLEDEEDAEFWTREHEEGATRSTAVKTQASEEKRQWNKDFMRDQRFLSALLNGGREEELGSTDQTRDRGPEAAG